jgi:hypothetical protein
MARVPVITSPCPLRVTQAPQPGKDFCGHCQRRVHNLDLMADAEREAFLKGCTGKVCVSYTVKRVALGLGLAAAMAGAGNAADVGSGAPTVVVSADSPYCDPRGYGEVTVGGTEAGEKLQWVEDTETEKPELPDIEAAAWLPTPKG